MPLSIAERKYDMPHGALQQVARAEGVANSYVTAVLNGSVQPKSVAAQRKVRRIQVALARKLGRPVDDVFPPAHRRSSNRRIAPHQ
jgi:hypothetical protein